MLELVGRSSHHGILSERLNNACWDSSSFVVPMCQTAAGKLAYSIGFVAENVMLRQSLETHGVSGASGVLGE